MTNLGQLAKLGSMNANITCTGLTTVTLSKRNLLALLHKVDDPASAKIIYRRLENGQVLVVQAEPDEEHYGERTPGVMTFNIEEFISNA